MTAPGTTGPGTTGSGTTGSGTTGSDTTGSDTTGPAASGAAFQVVGVSPLDEYVLLGDAGLAMAMVAAGAERLVDLRGETRPPRLPVQIDHFPIMDLEPGQDEMIAQAAAHVAALARAGIRVGVYCQAGISRTATVAIAYLVLGGATLADATAAVRRARPQAMPALELMRALERLAPRPPAALGAPAPGTAPGEPPLSMHSRITLVNQSKQDRRAHP